MVWIVRVKKDAKTAAALAEGLAPVDVSVHHDISSHRDFDAFVDEVKHALPDLTPAKIESRARCLFNLIVTMKTGDLVIVHGVGQPFSCVVMSTHETTQDGVPAFRFGSVIRHAMPEDFKNSMKAHVVLSECRVTRADARLKEIRASGVDTIIDDLEEVHRVGALLSAQDLAMLVADILSTDGYRCQVAPPGPDGGVDIYAGKGLLGLSDSLLVQVKSGKQVVTAPVVYQIMGNMLECGANATLIVSWSGFTAEARATVNKNPFKTKCWTYLDILNHLKTMDFDVTNKWQKMLKIYNNPLTP